MTPKSNRTKLRILAELEKIEARAQIYTKDGDGKIATDLELLLQRVYAEFDPTDFDRIYLSEIDRALMRMIELTESDRLRPILRRNLEQLRPYI